MYLGAEGESKWDPGDLSMNQVTTDSKAYGLPFLALSPWNAFYFVSFLGYLGPISCRTISPVMCCTISCDLHTNLTSVFL